MTVVFRSCLPRFNSNTNPSLSNDDQSEDNHSELHSSSTQCTGLSINQTKRKRGPRYIPIDDRPQPLLTRLIGTIFGDYGSVTKHKKRQIKKILPSSKSKAEKHFEDNQRTLNSLVTLLTQVESGHYPSNGEQRARNNNSRIDDGSSNTSSSYSFQTPRKMIDNQQQTQFYPMKITTETSTQFNDEPWFDLMGEDPTTINAWARIRHRLKPQEQKDILKALMIICANLFDVSLENKHL